MTNESQDCIYFRGTTPNKFGKTPDEELGTALNYVKAFQSGICDLYVKVTQSKTNGK
jgi:hypothetical protein